MKKPPSLVAITVAPRGDGIGVVAQMLHRVLSGSTPPCRTVTMFDGPARHPTLLRKIWFSLRLAYETFVVRPEWVLFAHIGLARAQKLIPAAWRRPYAVFFYGVEVWKPFSESDRALLRHATLRISISTYTARRVMEANPDIGDVVVCPLALLESETEAADRIVTLAPPLDDPSALIVLMVGGLRADQAYKGHDEMIAAWPDVVRAAPHAHLLVIGDGNDRPRLQALAQASPAAKHITFTGYASDAVRTAAYERAALFAMPSRGEGFGLVYVEAMARGVPCIGSIHDAAGDVITDGETGVLVDQDNIAALATTVAGLLNDPARRAAMGRASRARVEQVFTRSAFDRRILKLLGDTFRQAA